MGNSCRKVAIDVIPEKDVMLQVVDIIVALEDKLKKCERLTPAEEKQVAKARVVVKDMTKLRKTTESA